MSHETARRSAALHVSCPGSSYKALLCNLLPQRGTRRVHNSIIGRLNPVTLPARRLTVLQTVAAAKGPGVVCIGLRPHRSRFDNIKINMLPGRDDIDIVGRYAGRTPTKKTRRLTQARIMLCRRVSATLHPCGGKWRGGIPGSNARATRTAGAVFGGMKCRRGHTRM